MFLRSLGIVLPTFLIVMLGFAYRAERRPCRASSLLPRTPDEIRRHAAAELRKQMRREMEQRFAAARTSP